MPIINVIERGATSMALYKMKSIGLIDENNNEILERGHTKEEVQEMFKAYIDVFRNLITSTKKYKHIGEYIDDCDEDFKPFVSLVLNNSDFGNYAIGGENFENLIYKLKSMVVYLEALRDNK